jgi:hypothetical protein
MKTKFALSAVAMAVALFSQGVFAQASSPTRAEVKAQVKTGTLAPAGERAEVTASEPKSMKTRAERKAEVKSDKMSGKLEPAGEAADTKAATPASGPKLTRAQRKAATASAVKAGQEPGSGQK